jgi:hypothetical protein
MFEWFKLAKICMEQNLKFIKDKWCFYTLVFMKINVHNQLNTHLNLWVRMFGPNFFILDTFLFDV